MREGGGSGVVLRRRSISRTPVELRKMQEDASKLAASSTSGDEREAEIRDKEQDEDDYTHSKEEASLTDKIADDRLIADEMLRKVESELSSAETAIGEKFKLLDADNDGIMSLEELLNVTNVCKTTEIGEDAENELERALERFIRRRRLYSRRRSETLVVGNVASRSRRRRRGRRCDGYERQ